LKTFFGGGDSVNDIDHTKVGEVVPLDPNEHIEMFKVLNPQKSTNYIVYEVQGMRMIKQRQ